MQKQIGHFVGASPETWLEFGYLVVKAVEEAGYARVIA